MTNPTEQFRSAVESALESLTMHSVKAPDGTITIYHEGASPIEALASIQASTVKLFTRLVGEDEPMYSVNGERVKLGDKVEIDFSTVDKITKSSKFVEANGRNNLRAELRQKIDQLIKDLSK